MRMGFGQVEIVISTIIVGAMLVTSLTSVAASKRSQYYESARVRGNSIAEALMSEILPLPMREPSCDCGYGLETGETGSNRLNFDDVDDYNGLVDTPPKSKDGTACDGYTGWTQRVAVDMVSANDWNTTTSTYANTYRVTVSISQGTTLVSKIVGYRTSGTSSALTGTVDSVAP